MSFKLTTLDNGLRVASLAMPGVESLTVGVWADVGSRFESENTGGISHFLEHMAFKGTKTRTAQDIAIEFDSIGGHLNAYTSSEHTVYYAKVLKEDLARSVEVLGDIMINSTFAAEELERERDVILQEIAMHHDSPDDMVFEYHQQTLFKDQALGRSILGTPDLVSSYKRDDLIAYMNKFYRAPNMLLVACGNLEHENLVSLAKKHLGSLNAAPRSEAAAAAYKGGDFRKEQDLEQLHMILGFKGFTYADSEYYSSQVLAILLGGGMSSRLFQEVREKRGLAYSIYSFSNSYSDCGNFGVYTGTTPEKTPEMLKVVAEQLLLATEDISEDELARAKAQVKSGILMSCESTSSQFDTVGKQLLCFQEYKEPQKVIKLVDAVSMDDVKRAMRQVLREGEITFTALGEIAPVPEFDEIKALFG